MKLSSKISSRNSLRPSLTRQWRLGNLYRTADSHIRTLTMVAVAAAWVPLFVLCALRGKTALLSFLTDYATLSRFLIVLPVLILAERPLQGRLDQVARHFQADVVAEEQLIEFRAAWASHDRARSSKLAKVVIVVLTYATAAWLSQYLSPTGEEFVSWWKGGVIGFRSFSLAGTWAFFIIYPILGYFTYLWLWRHLMWARFLAFTSLLDLRLIAAHPDRLGGLGFIEASMLGQLPFAFCLGVGFAGAMALRVLNEGARIQVFRYFALALIAAVLIICVAPYLCFTRPLMQMRRRGMETYGAFAHAVGEQFEKKWLQQTDSLTEDVLTVPDFSTTADLYSVVHNIGRIRIIPVGAVDIYAVVVSTLIPAIPVVIAAIPFNILVQAAVKLLF